MQTTITTFDNTAEGWERALYAFLAEKERRSGSRRTVEGYSRMLQHCFGTIGKPPDKLTSQEVFAWAYGAGLSGKQPSSVTIGARLACLSSFFHFLIRMEAVSSNPCDALERPKVSVAPPRGLGGTDIQKLLAVIPETPTGLRDRAIVLTLTLTGRRRAEVLNMKVGDITLEDGKTWYRYRGKGGKTGKRELPQPAFVALTLALSAFGRDIAAMAPDASLWPARRGDGLAIEATMHRCGIYSRPDRHVSQNLVCSLQKDGSLAERHRQRFFESPKDATKIKLRIVEKYLKPWASKVGSQAGVSRVCVVDAFAGRGVYDDGTAGSPKLILDRARDTALEGRKYKIAPVLVEKKRGYFRALSALCDQYSDVERYPIHGDFWQQIERVKELISSAPYLLIVDPFGIKGLDYLALAGLANASPRCDLIVTFVQNAVPRLESQYRDAVAQAIGPRAVDDCSAAETFARNMSRAASFLPAGRFPIKQSFDSASAYELIVFSRSPHAYRLWNDFMADEWDLQLSTYRSQAAQPPQQYLSGFEEVTAEAEARGVLLRSANAVLDWLRESGRGLFTREEMCDYFAVQRFCEFHTSTLGQGLGYLGQCGRVRRQKQPKPRIATDPWSVIDTAPVQ